MDDKTFKALLAIDSYHRGYNEWLELPETQGLIGNASYLIQSDVQDDTQEYLASFYASSYTLDSGEVIISYRGTDNKGLDIPYGYGVGAGMTGDIQSDMAIRFYQQVAKTVYGENVDLFSSATNISFVGHSMGAGHAGYVAAIYNKNASLLDTMTFEKAANYALEGMTHDFNLTLSDQNDLGEKGGNILAYNENFARLIYGRQDEAPFNLQNYERDSDINGITNTHIPAVAIWSNWLDAINTLLPNWLSPMTIDEHELELPEDTPLGWSKHNQMGQRHDGALHVMIVFSESDEIAGVKDGWKISANYFIPLLFNNGMALAAGADALSGGMREAGDYAGILKTALAYSTIDEGTRIFGDTGIRALFNDAHDLGMVVDKTNTSGVLQSQATAFSRVFVQYAGQLALNGIEYDENGSLDPREGVLKLSQDEKLLTVDFSDELWGATGRTDSYIAGKAEIVSSTLEMLPDETDALMEMAWGISGYDALDRFVFKTQDEVQEAIIPERIAEETEKATFFAGTDKQDVVTGSVSKELIAGGKGDDILSGGGENDILVGGSGSDRLYGGAGDDILVANVRVDNPDFSSDGIDRLYGGAGNDTYTIEITSDIGWALHRTDLPHIIINDSDGKFKIDISGWNFDENSFQLSTGRYDNLILGPDHISNIRLVVYPFHEFSPMENTISIGFGDGYQPILIENVNLSGFSFSDITTENGMLVFDLMPVDSSEQTPPDLLDNIPPGVTDSGTTGDDIMAGSFENNIILAGAGNDVIADRGGDDTYLYRQGGGNDVVDDSDGEDVIAFGENITFEDLTFSRDGTSLRVDIAQGGSVTISGQFAYGVYTGGFSSQIETISYGGGSINAAAIRDLLNTGTEGNDLIAGYGVADTLAGGLGNDTLEGNGGDDLFIYSLGDGDDVISDAGSFNTDTLRFEGIVFADLTFDRTGNGKDLLVEVEGGGSVLIKGQFFSEYQEAIDVFEADDGFISTDTIRAQLLAQAASTGDDLIAGFHQDDTLDGGLGNDILEGNNGDDLYLYDAGTGDDSIYDAYGNNTLQLNGIASGDISFSRSENGQDLQIDFSNGGSVYIEKQFNPYRKSIETLTFDDGSMTVADIRALLIAQGALDNTTGDDRINGFGISDTLEGGLGNDILHGAGGVNDLYIYNPGDGNDVIFDEGANSTLRFNGIASEDLTFSRVNNDEDLLIEVNGGGSVLVQQHFLYYAIDIVEFAGGSLTAEHITEIINMPLANVVIETSGSSGFSGTAGEDIIHAQAGNDTVWAGDGNDVMYGGADNDRLEGEAGEDVLIGGAGDDTLIGGAGNDTLLGGDRDRYSNNDGNDSYHYAFGGGEDIIFDSGGEDSLYLDGLSLEDVSFSRINDDKNLLIEIAGGGAVLVQEHFAYDYYAIDTFVFDASILSAADMRALIVEQQSTDGDDSISGFTQADTLEGGIGNDTLNGGGGNDLYIYNFGDSDDVIWDSYGTDTLRFKGIPLEDLKFSRPQGSDDLLIEIAGGSSVLVQYHFFATIQIDTIEFDGGSLSAAEVKNMLEVPQVASDSYETEEGMTLVVDAVNGVLANDTDINGDNLAAILVGNVQYGTLIFNSDGSFSYTHDGSEIHLHDNFTYKANDGAGDSYTVTVALNVSPVNDAPETVADNYVLAEGETLNVVAAEGVLANDTDAENDTLVAILKEDVMHGSLTFNADGSFTYIHDGSENHNDSFTYTMNDGASASNTVTVSFNVNPVNDAPEAIADSYELSEGQTLHVAAIEGVLANDMDAEENGLSAILVNDVAYGTLTLNTDGSFSYTHNGSSNYADSFSYKVNDGTEDGNTVTVSLTIEPVVPSGQVITGTSGHESLNGGVGDDTISGLEGADTIYGGDGNDSLDGGSDRDHLYGEGGNDTLISGTGYDYLDGGDGDDVLIGTTGQSVTMVGGAGMDTFVGGSSSDKITLGEEDFREVYGAGGADLIIGTALVDTLYGGDANDTLYGGGSGDYLYGDAGTDRIYGEAGNDTIYAGSGYDSVDGGDGDDHIYGENTKDTLIGGLGNDLLDGGDHEDTLYGGEGNDTLLGGAGMDILYGDAGDDILDGGEDNTNDTLYGGDGNDSLYGGGRNDVLIGGIGDDTLAGGVGNDTFFFAGDANSVDIITDFVSGQDVIDLSDSSFNGMQFTELSLTDDGGDAVIGFGNGQTIRLTDIDYTTLIASDFMFAVPANSAPVATVDSYELDEGQTLNIAAIDGVLVNDSDAEDDVLSAILVSDVAHGMLVLNADGSFSYTHDGSSNYADSFSYKVNDGTEDGNTVTVSLTIETTGQSITGTSGNDTLVGGDGDDTITGAEGNDTLYGGTGNDSMEGGAGSDRLYGEAGNDTLTSSSGDDLLDGGEGDDLLTGNALYTVTLVGGAGMDTFIGGEGHDRITVEDEDYRVVYGNGGNDSIVGSSLSDTLYGGDGTDTLRGGDGDDNLDGGAGGGYLYGENGDDTLYGGTTSHISLDGGAGNDLLIGREGSVTLIGNAGIDTLIGGNGNDRITLDDEDYREVYGYDGWDTITGSSFSDTLDGGAGVDTLYGGFGSDLLDGGLGNDRVYGEDGDDTLMGGLGYDTLDGGDGNDLLIGNSNNSTRMYGGAGADTFVGGDGNDYISLDDEDYREIDGKNGTDSIVGSAFSDTIYGGGHSDTLYGGGGDDLLYGEDHPDVIYGGSGSDSIYGGSGFDTIEGGDGNDSIEGGFNHDTITGGNGSDTLIGDEGNDVMDGGADNDEIYGGANEDTIHGGVGDDSIEGGIGHDYIYGGDGFDTLIGDNGDDIIYGDAGNDVLSSGSGFDTLDGGAGVDTMTGGIEGDIFDFSDLTHSTDSARDVITDFEQLTDKIDLSGLGFTGIQSGASSGTILGFTTVNGITVIDADGSDFSIELAGNISLTDTDFIF